MGVINVVLRPFALQWLGVTRASDRRVRFRSSWALLVCFTSTM